MNQVQDWSLGNLGDIIVRICVGGNKIRSVAGLGVNITEVYSCVQVYLKGFFNANDAWRGDQDLGSWRLGTKMSEVAELQTIDAPEMEFSKGYPIAT